jgi:hypothetical protein
MRASLPRSGPSRGRKWAHFFSLAHFMKGYMGCGLARIARQLILKKNLKKLKLHKSHYLFKKA